MFQYNPRPYSNELDHQWQRLQQRFLRTCRSNLETHQLKVPGDFHQWIVSKILKSEDLDYEDLTYYADRPRLLMARCKAEQWVKDMPLWREVNGFYTKFPMSGVPQGEERHYVMEAKLVEDLTQSVWEGMADWPPVSIREYKTIMVDLYCRS